jgi:hypothetical protein
MTLLGIILWAAIIGGFIRAQYEFFTWIFNKKLKTEGRVVTVLLTGFVGWINFKIWTVIFTMWTLM